MPGPLPAVPKGVRADFHFSSSGAPNMQMRLFFQYTGTLNVTDATAWVANISSAMSTFMHSVMNADVTFLLTQITDLSSNTAPQVSLASEEVGGAAGTALPNGVAMVYSKHILRRYRGGHPRIYIPGMVAGYLATANTWSAATQSSILTELNTMFTAMLVTSLPVAIGTATHVNISYFSGFTNHTYPSGRVKPIPNPRVTPLVDAVVNLTPNAVVASQRRRNEQP